MGLVDELKELAALQKDGLLSAEEYKDAKAAVLLTVKQQKQQPADASPSIIPEAAKAAEKAAKMEAKEAKAAEKAAEKAAKMEAKEAKAAEAAEAAAKAAGATRWMQTARYSLSRTSLS